MIDDLRAQALERMRQITPTVLIEAVSEPTPPKIEQKKNSAENLPTLFAQFDLDRDRLILLAVLAFLYFDHASPKILLAILYIML